MKQSSEFHPPQIRTLSPSFFGQLPSHWAFTTVVVHILARNHPSWLPCPCYPTRRTKPEPWGRGATVGTLQTRGVFTFSTPFIKITRSLDPGFVERGSARSLPIPIVPQVKRRSTDSRFLRAIRRRSLGPPFALGKSGVAEGSLSPESGIF